MSDRDELNKLLDRLEDVGEFGDYDYSWWEFHAWYDPQARIYYWFEDAGCSCSSFMDSVDSIGELSVGRKEELLNAANSAGRNGVEGWDETMSAIRDHKAAA